ncbi:hypothetical protein [Myxococcus sp. RHSTA-1-4]|nr:hypothetical protein [Myxococcus sp. RHSTA-1-4]MBZ4420693.1 hypothetical protein [Myxococcus sp. RHSTA-1-4]
MVPEGLDDPALALLCIRVERAGYRHTATRREVRLAGRVKATRTSI